MKYDNKATVACVNFAGDWGNKAARLEKMRATVQQAARQGADIIVFPEMALSGYECDEEGTRLIKPCRMHHEAAETVPGPSTEEMAKLAKELGVYVIFGMPERDKKDPQIVYNVAAVIAPDGILGTQGKLHLAGPPNYREASCWAPGPEMRLWQTRFGTVGVLVCYDFWFYPELPRIMALRGARLIVNCSASATSPGKTDFLIQQAACRAAENFVYTATSNLSGLDRTKDFCGTSNIAGFTNSRLTSVLARAGETEEVISATLNFDIADYWGIDILNWKADRRAKLITEEFNKLNSF